MKKLRLQNIISMNQNKMSLSIYLLAVFIFCLFFAESAVAQQQPAYSQYSLNYYLFNPAAAGLRGYTSINLIAREQWVGFRGTPKTHSLSIDSRILRNSFIMRNASVKRRRRLNSRSGRVAWGAHIFNDHNSLLSRTGMEGTYAYHIDLGPGQMSFGLTGMLYQFKLSGDEVILSDDQNDNLITGSNNAMYIPDADVGIFYMQREFYGGLSVSQVLGSSVKFGETGDGTYELKRHYYLIGGYDYQINNDFKLEPSFLLKVAEFTSTQLDIQAKVTYLRNYWGGLGFRTGSAMIIFAGLKVDKYHFGYAFDYNFGSIMKHTYGSHEVFLSIKFGENARRYKWLNTY